MSRVSTTLGRLGRTPVTRVGRRFMASKASTSYVAVTHPEDAGSLPESYLSQIKAHSDYLTNTYARPPLILSHGKGSWVFDVIGRKYLDFSAGIAVNALGHGDEQIAQLAGEQAGRMIHTSNVWYNEWAGELAQLLVETTRQHGGLGFAPGGKEQRGEGGAKVFFSNSGTEANEGAIKFARKYGKETWANEMTNGVGAARKWEDSTKTKVIHFTNAFHGRSMGALSATANPKYQLPFTPLIPGFELVQYGDIDGFRARIDEDTCAVLVEPIQGEGGVHEASEEFFRTLRAECDRVGAVLIFDEIQCGLFRSGSMWAHSKLPLDCHPDIVTMAKPLANGFPIGAIMVRDHIANTITPGSHGTTFGGSVFATRLAHHVLTRLSSPTLTAHIDSVAKHLDSRLSKLETYFPDLVKGPARGRGLIRGIPFKDTTVPSRLVDAARQRGVLLLTAGKDAVRLVPSLNVERAEVDFALDVIESVLSTLATK